MGNSLLDIVVFGRRGGLAAAEFAQNASNGKLTLDHVRKYNLELDEIGVELKQKAPILLPDYRGKVG